MKKLLTALLLSITLIQLCWAAVGPYNEHAATLARHAGHHQLQPQADGLDDTVQAGKNAGAKDAAGFCSSCEMQAGSLGYPAAAARRLLRAASPVPAGFTIAFSSHIPDHPEEPDWLAAHLRGVAARL
ncbi:MULTISPECIES: hypothetical protein [unclassified Herbaspirillum]|uniref:hypothetical protein n=1 Tax=unclassified Herbaspirillum TaxID=2624150 RepID=UPI0011527C70|nr:MULTISPECIES: hypothetical protein [unclassified Herbaspirillum]MBB5393222.1 hypothetical protein [Herbaspirillum sp. SJZ102]TQK04140.1 hypothetical protein FB599_2690 [Herbaspirillum sp. SJZ130]TQK10075.1 hypothetical protein FB598_3072 [Herbaspirillum sp. SJZ106]